MIKMLTVAALALLFLGAKPGSAPAQEALSMGCYKATELRQNFANQQAERLLTLRSRDGRYEIWVFDKGNWVQIALPDRLPELACVVGMGSVLQPGPVYNPSEPERTG